MLLLHLTLFLALFQEGHLNAFHLVVIEAYSRRNFIGLQIPKSFSKDFHLENDINPFNAQNLNYKRIRNLDILIDTVDPLDETFHHRYDWSGLGATEICDPEQSYPAHVWKDSYGAYYPALRRNLYPGVLPQQQEICIQKNVKGTGAFEKLGPPGTGDPYTLHPDEKIVTDNVDGQYFSLTHNFHHRSFYPRVEFVHKFIDPVSILEKPSRSDQPEGDRDDKLDNDGSFYDRHMKNDAECILGDEWNKFNNVQRYSLDRDRDHRKYDDDCEDEMYQVWYTKIWENQDWYSWERLYNRHMKKTESLFFIEKFEGWGPYAERNMDVWKQDWYSLNANVDCGDNPDMVPIWAGQQGMHRASISEFNENRKQTDGYANDARLC